MHSAILFVKRLFDLITVEKHTDNPVRKGRSAATHYLLISLTFLSP